MRLTFVRPYNSIVGPVCTGEVADFIVLSGQNGSGKSNLLEAIQQGAITIDGVTDRPEQLGSPRGVRLFGLAQLVAAAEGAQSAAGYRDSWVALHRRRSKSSHSSRIRNLSRYLRPVGVVRLVELAAPVG